MILALAGGVGGAELAHGLARVLPTEELVIAVNTGDDFEHLGLHVSPDIDSVMYKLAGLNDPVRGWGLAGESWHFLDALGRLGGETWFRLGDRDLATHVERTRRLAAGATLSDATAALCRALGIEHTVAPMTDSPVRTMVATETGEMPFQDYFVRLRSEPAVSGFRFDGAESARPSPGLAAALTTDELAAIILCPSNPFVSVDPILSVPGVRDAVRTRAVPVVAVSPIVGGDPLKGPAAKMMTELGIEPSAVSIAAHYDGLIDGHVLDLTDRALVPAVEAAGVAASAAQTIMRTAEDECALAQEVVRFAATLESRSE